MEARHLPGAYLAPATDAVRERLEAPALGRTALALLARSGGGRVLDLGCGAGLGPLLDGSLLHDYVGVDFREPEFALPGRHVLHDLRNGLGPVGDGPFDLYLAGFGVASHMRPDELARLIAEIAAHARPGSLVALEALGALSLEWPRLWDTAPGRARTLGYELAHDVDVHPWRPAELGALLEHSGIRMVRAEDRSVQAGPKVGDGRYWPGLPPVRQALDDLLAGHPPASALSAALPPLPAGPTAAVHHRLAARRMRLVARHRGSPEQLAATIWALERGSGGGFGHGLLIVGRVA